jgi:AcrR family transcriptional regulator
VQDVAGFTERTFFRHFADKREVFFGGEAQLRDLLTGAVAAVPAGTRPLPTLRAAFHQAVPLIERNLPVTERRMPVIVATPALRERALAKSEALVAALTDALRARGVAEPLAVLCAQVGMTPIRSPSAGGGPTVPTTCTPTSTGPSPICGSPPTP